MNRIEIADMVVDRLRQERTRISEQYAQSVDSIGYFYIDNLLPDALARRLHQRFPKPDTMKLKRSLREYKFIAAQMNEYDPILEEAVYAFQDERVVEIIKEVCQMQSAFPDVHLYAGGISMMGNGQFLNPHLDNSHDKDRNRWRVLNLLYYVTPDWTENDGGELELWPDGPKGQQTIIGARYNRLAVMATHNNSWHSVSPVKASEYRCCISNYYFSDEPLRSTDSFHVTSFRGRPEQKARDLILRGDIALRGAIRKVFKNGLFENPHVYKRPEEDESSTKM